MRHKSSVPCGNAKSPPTAGMGQGGGYEEVCVCVCVSVLGWGGGWSNRSSRKKFYLAPLQKVYQLIEIKSLMPLLLLNQSPHHGHAHHHHPAFPVHLPISLRMASHLLRRKGDWWAASVSLESLRSLDSFMHLSCLNTHWRKEQEEEKCEGGRRRRKGGRRCSLTF